jgi:threonyl-tRNA synthetase
LNLKSFAQVETRCHPTRKVLIESGINYVEVANEAAFYGPKIDVQVWSAIGREFTIATNQVDFAVPAKFGLTYRDKDNSNKTPLCIHRAPLGTHERFIGFLIEHYAGNFPLWLAPDQVRVITLNDDEALINYAKPIVAELRANMVRVDADFSATPFKAKISNAEQLRVHTMLVIGGRDMEAGAVSVRLHHGGPQGANPNHHRVILALSTAFWDAYLRGDAAALAWLNGDGPRRVMQAQDQWQFSAH